MLGGISETKTGRFLLELSNAFSLAAVLDKSKLPVTNKNPVAKALHELWPKIDEKNRNVFL